ncbi:DUF2490 domain-containing protein [Mucilaginibacter puniceus]
MLNSTKINNHWGLQFDVMFRSADEVKYVRNFLFRSAIAYTFDKKNNFSLGHTVYETNSGPAPSTSLTEHRINEQYVHNEAIKAIAITNRFRLEQRFIEKTPTTSVFSQRFRYFLKFVIPLAKQESTFKKGPFVSVQDEIFLNVQNKGLINRSLFDQNRLYGGIGQRFSSKLDIEVGYMNLFQKRTSVDVRNNIIQLALFTRF